MRYHEIVEAARFDMHRCTAVSVNAMLKHFGKPPITVVEVPENAGGLVADLEKRGLKVHPEPRFVGQTVEQFVKTHPMGVWFLGTPGHAMALIDGELVDTMNRGPDDRRLDTVARVDRI